MTRVLLAEDSAVTREYLTYLLGEDPGLEVVGCARDGLEALEQAERLRPDLIVMDVHMPRMNGLEATRRIMERVPTPIVIVSASVSRDEVALTFEALQAGALTVVEKPPGPGHPDQEAGTRRLLEAVRLMAEVKVVRRWPARQRSRPPAAPAPKQDRLIRVVAMAASTGGPQVIAEILGQLPARLGVPLLVVQHITPGFAGGLADWLGRMTPLTVKIAEAGEVLRAGSVYLGPSGFQLGVTRDDRIRLARGPAEGGFCPSATHLFRSVAEVYGQVAAGVLLSGMGQDGVAGLRQLRDAGGTTIAQDEETSVVFGMPGEAIRQGAAELVLSPDQIAAMLRAMTRAG
ncbi:MAG: chemotaxis-specific protein-glutamate methyltransferase CheB [Candidatus Rokubacteria bacterium]|nr:chemotaxis-specific protein-glutamate methyltransferase CheB [Candidatus Rokubacteria bacterium]